MPLLAEPPLSPLSEDGSRHTERLSYHQGDSNNQTRASKMEALDMNESEFKLVFESFIRAFCINPVEADSAWDETLFETLQFFPSRSERQPYYIQKLVMVIEQNLTAQFCTLQLSLKHIKSSNLKLLRQIIRHPADSIIFMDDVLTQIAHQEYEGASHLVVKTALYHHPFPSCMRGLDPAHIETLVALKGIVIRCSSVLPEMQSATFRCTSRNVTHETTNTICGFEMSVPLSNGEVNEPIQCLRCNAKHSFEIFHSRCVFGNKQLVKIQESLETVPGGETPQTILAYVYDEFVDAVKPGDFVELVGIYKAAGIRYSTKLRGLKAVFRTYIDTNMIYKDRLMRYTVTEADLNGPAADASPEEEELAFWADRKSAEVDMSPEFIAKMKTLGSDPDIYEKLVKSFAPNIWECDDVKKGLLCQLFGGTPKYVAGRSTRSDIHILLCGDPSTAKSQLLHYVHRLAPRGVYTCGRGSSAVGLTAAVTRDVETSEFVLESGAVVLSDRGICCIDEFDKMDEKARVILHEVMEQQTVSIAKAGIVCSLNARTAVLASANPIHSRYDTKKSCVENINLPHSLMSRFDLVYLMLDNANPLIDRALAEHVCSLYSEDNEAEKQSPPIDRRLMAQYISYARQYCKPMLNAKAGTYLTELYVELRRRGSDRNHKVLSATARQLESLIRLSEALAKLELSSVVDVRHVQEATRLMQVATYSTLIDPTTGRLDFDQLNAGISGEMKLKRQRIEAAIIEVLKGASEGLLRSRLFELVSEKVKTEHQYYFDQSGREFNLLLRELEDFGSIGKAHGGRIILLSSQA